MGANNNETEAGTHRVVGKQHRVREGGEVHVYEPGDRVTPSEAALDAFPDRFERVEETSDSAPALQSGAIPNPKEKTVAQISDWASKQSDPERVQAMREAERERGDETRTTAIDVLDGRADTLERAAEAEAAGDDTAADEEDADDAEDEGGNEEDENGEDEEDEDENGEG